MQIDIKLIKNHFEKSMDKYDENAVVQKLSAEKLVDEILKTGNHFNKILELGAGTGLLTRKIQEKISYTSYTANDLSDKSKQYLEKILPEFSFISGNAGRIRPSTKFDLIASNAVFQWFTNLDEIFALYRNFLNKNGLLAFTTFLPENFNELKEITGLALAYKSEEEIKSALNKNFEIIKMESFTKVMEFNSPLELLYHMKNTGVNSLNNSKWTFADVKDFCRKYSEKFDQTALTYAPIIVLARKIN